MNRLLDLPEDILVLIYKWVFKECAKQIDNKNARSLYDFYDMLKKSKLCYCINMDERDERDDTNSIYLYRRLYIKEDSRLYKIIYIEYPISFVCADFEYIRTIIEEFASIIYNDDNEDKNLRNLHRCRSGIYNLEYTRDTIRVYIDKNKLRCRVDLEKAVIMGYELIYYSLKLINILELNAYDVYGDIDGLFEWLEDYNLLLGYTITNDVVTVELGC